MPPRSPWSRGNIIAVISIIVSVIGILCSLFNLEVRHLLQLNQSSVATDAATVIASTQVPTAPVAIVPKQIPIKLSTYYEGTVNNNDGRSGKMTLTLNSRMSGNCTFATPPFNSDGPFTSFVIDASGNLSFTVVPTNNSDILYFTGSTKVDNSLSGSYSYSGGGGTWIVYPK